MKNRFALDRRHFLKGTGVLGSVAVGLPLLEAMLDEDGEALASGADLPKRFISWFWGNGVNLARFEPTTTGADWVPSPLLSPLADIKDYLTICTGLQNRSEQKMTHHEGLCAFTGHTYVRRNDLGKPFASDHGGPTIDQLIADTIAAEVQLPVHSLQLQISKGFSPADGGTTAEFFSARGEPGNLTALPPQPNPLRVWQTLFGGEIAPTELRASMLDFVKDDLNRLTPKVGVADQQRIESHLDSVRQLEQKLQTAASCSAPAIPSEQNLASPSNEKISLVNDIMVELLVKAFECDLTRVASMLFLPIAGEAVFSELASTQTHHFNSHVTNGEAYDQGVMFALDRMGDLMRALRNREEVTGGNLLDSTLLYASSDCAVGWHHGIARQPIIIGGHGRGYLKHPGVHFQATPAADPNASFAAATGNMTDVLLTLLRCFDPDAASIGEPGTAPASSSIQPELLA